MASDDLTVSISLHEVKSPDTLGSLYPLRVLTLSAPDWSIKIGRATSTGSGPRQSDINAWYSSRVISREHAELKADPVTRDVLIRDCGSMHGTHIESRRLRTDTTERIHPGDSIIFGAEVARGDETFLPVEVVASYEWSDGISEPLNADPTAATSRNHFAVYYSDEDPADYDPVDSDSEQSDMYGEDPVEQIREEANVSVPESEVSEAPAGMSSDEGFLSDEDSPTSSSIMPTSFKAKRAADELNEADGILDEHVKTEVVSSNARVFAAMGEPAENIEDDYEREDSYYEDSSIFDEGEHEEKLTNAEVVEVIENVVDGLSKGKSRAEILREFEAPPASPPPPSRPVRAPSPSDAAMAKPPTEDRLPPFGYYLAPPPAHNDYYQASQTYLPPTTVERNPSAWAGYKSVLYDPIAAAPAQNSSYLFPSQYQVPMPINRAGEISGFGQFGQQPEALYNTPMVNVSARQSVDLGGEPEELEVLRPSKRGEKRKRDDTQDDEVLVKDSVEVPEDNAQPASVELATIDPADLRPILMAQTVDSIKSPVAEPVKKKQRKSKKDDGARGTGTKSTFAKYAITFAAGSVATIIGLVSLPKDFFV